METSAAVNISGPLGPRYEEILTPPALAFLAELHRAFDGRRRELLDRRKAREAELVAGATLDFLAETKDVREGDWRGAAPAPRPGGRPGGGTRPAAAHMNIHALNSRAHTWLAGPQEADTPPW